MNNDRVIKLFEELMLLNAEITAVAIQLYTELGMKNDCEHKFVDPHVVNICSTCKQEVEHAHA